MTDPFVYQRPNDTTRPLYAAIRAAESAARAAIQRQLDSTGPAQAAYDAINDVCRSFHAAIMEHAPLSADRAAAERCVRIARMAANEAVAAGPDDVAELRRQCVDNLRAARWQACAAIALAPASTTP